MNYDGCNDNGNDHNNTNIIHSNESAVCWLCKFLGFFLPIYHFHCSP